MDRGLGFDKVNVWSNSPGWGKQTLIKSFKQPRPGATLLNKSEQIGRPQA